MTGKWTDFVAGAVLQASQLNDVLDNFADIAIFNETQANGTQGGGSVATTWSKRTLNTTNINNLGATLSSSVISLPAGTYLVEAQAPFLDATAVKLRLRNTSDGTDAIIGQNAYFDNANIVGGNCNLVGTFTIAATKNFELQYFAAVARGTNGLGVSSSGGAGTSEVYAIIQITRIG